MKPTTEKGITHYINSKEWVKVGNWKCSILADGMFGPSMKEEFVATLKVPMSMNMLQVSDDYFFEKPEFLRVQQFFYESMKEDVEYLHFVSRTLNEVAEATLKKVKSAETLQAFFEALPLDMALGMIIHPLDPAIEKYFEDDEYDPEILRYVYPIKTSHMIQERIDLLSIKLKQGQADIEHNLKHHIDTYAWMSTINWKFPLYDRSHYVQQLDTMNKQAAEEELKRLTDTKSVEAKIEKFLAGKDERHKKMLTFLRELLDAKMLNWDVVGIANLRLRELLRNDHVLSNIDYDVVVSLVPDEVLALQHGELSPQTAGELARERARELIIIYQDERLEIYPVQKETIRQLDLYNMSLGQNNLIKGSVAYKGKARGRVQIIDSSSEVPKMKRGSVLVCSMTNPDFMPAAVQATAIVTDQGGILCHAAIVSRELKIPCIIGTKIATKVLKDGDLVEVDAEKGVVQILQRTK